MPPRPNHPCHRCQRQFADDDVMFMAATEPNRKPHPHSASLRAMSDRRGARQRLEMQSDDKGTDFEVEQQIEDAGTTTLQRLQQLVQKGYKPDFSIEYSGALWLRHPRTSFKYNVLLLYPTGKVVSLEDADEFRCYLFSR